MVSPPLACEKGVDYITLLIIYFCIFIVLAKVACGIRLHSADGTTPSGYTAAVHTDGDLPSALLYGIFTLDSEAISEYEGIMERLIPFVNNGVGGEFEGQYLADALSAFLIKLSGVSRKKYRGKRIC